MAIPPADVVRELDDVIALWTDARKKSKHNDLSDLGSADPAMFAMLIMTFSSAIERLSAPASSYRSELQRCREVHGQYASRLAPALLGIVQAMRADYHAGRSHSLHEIVHAELFSDFLGAATHLLEEGYKDPAAVIVGSVLEEHLRKLCAKHGVAPLGSDGKPKKASLINAELRKSAAFGSSEEKQITSWLDLRNLAAHGHYAKYDEALVRLMIGWVSLFVSQHPA